MTLGQRVAQKRKELGLSQEGLGEQLGVSRQAIYKWESDASLPEIDKLITLSKIFSVSVGWLLGVEEEGREEAPPQESGELTERQLQMVQEIVDRYLAAQPKLAPPKRRRLVKFLEIAAVLALIVVLFNLFSKLDRVTQDYNNLQYSVYDIDRNINSQIGSITSRVEDILKSQNSLTAEWSAELASTDLAANTATFDVRVVPKTYVEGMTAIFQARSGEDTAEVPVELGEDHAFTSQITCPLTDYIDVTVVLVTGDKRETQWLNDFYNLYEETFPWLTLRNDLWFSLYRQKDNTLPAFDSTTGPSVEVWNDSVENHFAGWNPDPPAKIQVGLFQDRRLVQWYEGRPHTVNWDGVPTEEFAWFRTRDITLEPGHIYCEAAVYTDEYGRQRVYEGEAIEYNESEQGWETPSGYQSSSDPADWEF